VFDATGVGNFAGHLLHAFPHLSESLSQQHRQLLAFLTAPSSSSVSLLTHHQQHQPELLLFALRDIRCSPGSKIGALLAIALSSFSVALLTLHQQHQPELLLSALRDTRCPLGSNIGALLGVELSSSCASLLKYLEHRLDSYPSLAWSPIIENMFSTYSLLELNQHRMLLSSDSDTNELNASFGIALSFMSSRIHSSLCSSPPLSIDAISFTLFG